MGKYGTFEEHKHPEYEEGMIEITIGYRIIVFNDLDKYKEQFDFYEEVDAKIAYELELKRKRYDNVILMEVQTHAIVKRVNK